MNNINIGVLALQGSFKEHISILKTLDGVNSFEAKRLSSLEECDGLIIPGGESSTMGKLIIDFGLNQKLISRIKGGMPVWGTCAGAILLAKKIFEEDYVHLGVMNMAVRRNAYGSQLDSFSTNVIFPLLRNSKNVLSPERPIEIEQETCSPIPTIFIRAPIIESINGACKILGQHQNKIIAVQENNMLATTFHPELTNDPRFHIYFCDMVINAKTQDKNNS